MNDWVKDFIETEDMSALTGVPTKAALILGSAVGTYSMFEYFSGGKCYSNASMKGKTVLITGSNTGTLENIFLYKKLQCVTVFFS